MRSSPPPRPGDPVRRSSKSLKWFSASRKNESYGSSSRLGRSSPSRDHLIAGCQLSFRRVKNFRTKNLKIFLARSIKVPISVACGKFLQLRLDWFQRKQKGSGEWISNQKLYFIVKISQSKCVLDCPMLVKRKYFAALCSTIASSLKGC